MGNAERKARKRNGEPFVHPEKVGTPAPERAVNRHKLERRAIKLINKALTEQRSKE